MQASGALIAVIVFMLIYYKIFGIIASFALVINIVLLVGLMSIPTWCNTHHAGDCGYRINPGDVGGCQRTYFERIKEEIRNGRPIQQAINEGYNGAFTSIFDANLTTILTANHSLCCGYRSNSRLCGNPLH